MPKKAKVVLWFIALLLFALPCIAAPPPGADLDGPLHTWFEHQHSITGAWCCKVADGHILADSDWRAADGHYEVWINGTWRPVPVIALRDPLGSPNPTGHAVVVDASRQRDCDPLFRPRKRNLISPRHARRSAKDPTSASFPKGSYERCRAK